MDVEIEAETILQFMQADFPKEFALCVQRAQILKLEEANQSLRDQLAEGATSAPSASKKEVTA